MVFANNMRAFSLTLTDASTGSERREYVDAMGTTWVKGERDDEFFIMLKNVDSRDALCKIFVDGVDLGYSYKIPRTRSSAPLGVMKTDQSLSDFNLITHALKFGEKTRAPTGGEDEDGHMPYTGSVTVQWYNCEWDYNCVKFEPKMTSSWSGAASSASSSIMHNKEQSQQRSEEGSTASTLINYPYGPTARRGELLATTTVQYTSDFGLAVRGLLTANETGMSAKRQKIVVINDQRERERE
jgi:hypothetical protein